MIASLCKKFIIIEIIYKTAENYLPKLEPESVHYWLYNNKNLMSISPSKIPKRILDDVQSLNDNDFTLYY